MIGRWLSKDGLLYCWSLAEGIKTMRMACEGSIWNLFKQKYCKTRIRALTASKLTVDSIGEKLKGRSNYESVAELPLIIVMRVYCLSDSVPANGHVKERKINSLRN